MNIPVKEIETLINQFSGMSSIVISANNVEVLAKRQNHVTKSASLIKLAVLNTIIDSGIDLNTVIPVRTRDLVAGSGVVTLLHPEKMTINSLMNMMISVSDNSATNILINYLGGVNVVNQWLQSMGLQSTRLNRLMMDTAAVQAGQDNVTTAKEILWLFKLALAKNDEVNSWFINQQFRYKLPGNFDELGLAVTVANKTGEGKYLDHDVARFTYGNELVDVVLLTSDFKNRAETISLFNQIGQLITTAILNN